MASFYHKPLSMFLYPILLFSFASVCLISLIESTPSGGFTIDLIHRDSLHSPSYDPSITRFERVRKVFEHSMSRKSSLKLTSPKYSTLESSDSIESRIIPNGGEYLMWIQIGTPPVEVLAIADTGSDLTWTQCKPCSKCFKQNAPLFDPSKTKTYRTIPCDSEKCIDVGSASCDNGTTCTYQVSYGDRSYTIGDLAAETFTFGSSSKGNVSFPKVVFGCGHENAGTFDKTASGIIGLGGGSQSIISQLDKYIEGKFSYCLTFLDSNATSKISFGSNAVVTGPNVVSTPLLSQSPETFYYLTLEGISVGKKRLAYETVATKSDYDGSSGPGNIIIDSGTTLTYLPADFYNDLESSLVNAIEGKRVSDPQNVLNLCYKLPSDGHFDPPQIVAHFTGADLEITRGSTFIEVDPGVVCLTFVPSEDLAIFGNLHQMNVQIGYDLENQKLSFRPTDCSKPQ